MPKKGERYRHFKGKDYVVEGIVRHSETMQDYVLYRHADEEQLWIRPLGMWEEIVKDAEGKSVKRFTLIED